MRYGKSRILGIFYNNTIHIRISLIKYFQSLSIPAASMYKVESPENDELCDLLLGDPSALYKEKDSQ